MRRRLVRAARGEGADMGVMVMVDKDGQWRGVYRLAVVAIVVALVVFRRNLSAEMAVTNGFGLIPFPAVAPVAAAEWFALLQENVIAGLVLLGVSDLVNYVLVGIMFVALYGALRAVSRGWMVLATAGALVAVAVYLATNQAFGLLALSERYAAAGSEAERAALLGAGEALLAVHNPGAAYQGTGVYVSLLLISLAGVVVSATMVRSGVFGRWTGYVGLLANGFMLGFFVVAWAAPAWNWVMPTLSAPFRVVWYALIAWRLWALGRGPVSVLLR